jgi:hypothetical protein
MIHHVLACALCDPSSPDGLNSGGQFIVDAVFWGFGAVAALAALCAIIGAIGHVAAAMTGKPLPPRQPADISPFAAELLSGQPQTCFWYPVRATDPWGTPVRMNRCCPRGHRTATLAKQHADRVAARITRTGR